MTAESDPRPVSRSVPVEPACPFCGTSAPTEMWMVVDVDERPDLAQALSEHRLNAYTCAACGDHGALDGPLLVARAELRPTLLYSPPIQLADSDYREALVGWWAEATGVTEHPTVADVRREVLARAATRDLVADAEDLAEGHLDIDDSAYRDFLCTLGRASDPRTSAGAVAGPLMDQP